MATSANGESFSSPIAHSKAMGDHACYGAEGGHQHQPKAHPDRLHRRVE